MYVNVLLPLLFLLYQIVIDFIDLFPFNDIHVKDKRLRKYEVIGNYPPLLIISACFLLHNHVSMWIGFLLTSIILVMHLLAWWIPYFTGCPAKVKNDYDLYFRRTKKCLPPIKDHIIPDVEHMGVGLILLITFVFQWVELAS